MRQNAVWECPFGAIRDFATTFETETKTLAAGWFLDFQKICIPVFDPLICNWIFSKETSSYIDIASKAWNTLAPMGRKRLIIAAAVIAFVVGSAVALLFQMGVDEQVIKNLLPRVEERLGVKITYREFQASLTGLSLQDVEVRPISGPGMYAAVKNLGISVRVGPLFIGEVDITSISADGLKMLIGPRIGGVKVDEWKNLSKRISGDRPAQEQREKDLGPEIHIVSGDIVFDVDNFKGSVEGINGMFEDAGSSAFDVDRIALSHMDQSLFLGEDVKILFSSETSNLEIKTKGPKISLSVEKAAMKKLFEDAKSFLSIFDHAKDNGKEIDQREIESRSALSTARMNIILTKAEGQLIKTAEKKKLLLSDMTVNLTANRTQGLSFRAGGRLPDGKAWTMSGGMAKDKNLKLAIEAPDVSLSSVGEFLLGSEHFDWTYATANAKINVAVTKEWEEIVVSGSTDFVELNINHPRLALTPIASLDLHADFDLIYRPTDEILNINKIALSCKLARGSINGAVDLKKRVFDLNLDIPKTPCANIFRAVPEEMRARLGNVELTGKLALGLRLAIDEATLDNTVVEANLDNQCRITGFGSVPEPSYFKGPFSYNAYSENDQDLRLITGPGTDRWISINDISPYVVETLLTTEDGKFWHHSGITLPEIARAIALNIKNDDLTHGASTITMQLAKNLFLTRERTFTRKLQELFFVWYLETYFEKDEILELYLNIVEFGPSIYGILDASEYYFGRLPEELNLLESVFLVRLLPSPVKKHQIYLQGEAGERVLSSLHKVLGIMLERKRIDKAEYSEAMSQKLKFRREGEPLPIPRPPILGHRFSQDTDSDINNNGQGDEGIPDDDWNEPATQ